MSVRELIRQSSKCTSRETRQTIFCYYNILYMGRTPHERMLTEFVSSFTFPPEVLQHNINRKYF